MDRQIRVIMNVCPEERGHDVSSAHGPHLCGGTIGYGRRRRTQLEDAIRALHEKWKTRVTDRGLQGGGRASATVGKNKNRAHRCVAKLHGDGVEVSAGDRKGR